MTPELELGGSGGAVLPPISTAGHAAFPWTLASAAGMGRMIPRSLYSLLVGR
ncbi:MAG: hypothetical protein P1V51_05470 [Deltaproteobacteria bacterium]|nr:hypothetical protein [Deltaproteobacteria bacterium]